VRHCARGVRVLLVPRPPAPWGRCGKTPRSLSTWHGQRVRIITSLAAGPAVREDPRLVTVLLRSSANAGGQRAECVALSDPGWQAIALIAGTRELEGIQLLADKDGWLRAFSAAGKSGWSDEDLVCRTGRVPATARTEAFGDGLGSLIKRMDAEPVRFVKGGFIH
jgi:hypothetical protein